MHKNTIFTTNMRIGSILDHLKTVWETWNVRGIVVLSLSLQAILILLSPLRKRSANTFLIFCVWSAYLLADWAAAFAVGHISIRQKNDKSTPDNNGDLIAFWAPFLLVHLGGPDTITAFALEDNALWLRHLVNLICQVSAAIYIFIRTLPKDELQIPALLMLLAGFIKYGERTRALYLASLKHFKESMLTDPDPGPNYAKLMDDYSSLKEAMLPAGIEIIPEPSRESPLTNYELKEGDLDEADVVEDGYFFFKTFKGLIVDLIFTFHQRSMSRKFFQKRTAVDAFKVISVELNFIYEILYTKVLVVHSKWGYIFRVVASSIIIMTLVLFTRLEKHQYPIFDITVTYALLYGAICLDVIALLMLITSDWSVAILKGTPILKEFLAKYVFFITQRNKTEITTCHIEHIEPAFKCEGNVIGQIREFYYSIFTGKDESTSAASYEVFNTKIWFRRWSESICAYNLLSVCLKRRPQKILKDGQKSYWCAVLVIIASIPLVILGVAGLSIFACCIWLIAAVSVGLEKAFNYFTDKLSLGEVFDGLKLKSILSYVWTKQANEGCNAKERCGIIISKLCVLPLYIIGLMNYCFRITREAIDNGKCFKACFKCFKACFKCSKACFSYADTFISYVAKTFGLHDILDSIKYVSRNPFLTKLWDFIYDELQVKSVFAEDTKKAKQIYEAKGEWVLHDSKRLGNETEIMEYVRGEYDRILLLWHIATELCYSAEYPGTKNHKREFSKILSDYMLYLLIKQPLMMSNVAGIGQIRFRDTCAEARRFFNAKGTVECGTLMDACQMILAVDTCVKPLDVKGDRSKSVLFDGCRLAKELQKREDKWKLMSGVWAELLSYAAGHCKAETHAQVLSKGGELITFVWLLMAHLGIGEQFQITEGHARAKLLSDA